MTDFRDAIAKAADSTSIEADFILMMPEIQSMRDFIIRMMESNCVGYWDFHTADLVRNWLQQNGLHETIINWVLDDK